MPQSRGPSWSRFVAITRPFFRSEARWLAFGLLLLLIIFILSLNGLNVLGSFVNNGVVTALEERQAHRFALLAMVWAGVFVAATAVEAFKRYTEGRLRLRWREWLTRHLIGKYLSGRVYYRLNGRRDIDNPDQRIS